MALTLNNQHSSVDPDNMFRFRLEICFQCRNCGNEVGTREANTRRDSDLAIIIDMQPQL